MSSIFSFSGTNGSVPLDLILGRDGNLYGATYGGGVGYTNSNVNAGQGTIFKITTNGILTTLITFSGPNGSAPRAGLVQGDDGVLYGTTMKGGAFDYGTVFRLTTNGVFTTIYSFDGTAGIYPASKLTFGADGDLYGTTEYPDTNAFNNGTIFKITTNGVLTELMVFKGYNGRHPTIGMTLSRDGNLYGALNDTFHNQYFGAPDSDGSWGGIYRLVQQPVLNSTALTNGSKMLAWTSFSDAVYRVEYKTNLVSPNWVALVTNVIAVSNSSSYTDLSSNSAQRFYRVRLLP